MLSWLLEVVLVVEVLLLLVLLAPVEVVIVSSVVSRRLVQPILLLGQATLHPPPTGTTSFHCHRLPLHRAIITTIKRAGITGIGSLPMMVTAPPLEASAESSDPSRWSQINKQTLAHASTSCQTTSKPI